MPDIQPREVARTQKMLLWAILAQIIMTIVIMVTPSPVREGGLQGEAMVFIMLVAALRLAVVIMAIVFLMMMMSALQRPMISRILAALAQFIPIVGLIVLVVVNQRAIGVLQRAGYRVGLMGARIPPQDSHESQGGGY